MIASLVVVSILCGARPADAQTTVSAAKVPLWQLPPFDRLHLTDGTGYDIEAVRIPAGTPFEAKPDEYIGRPGLPTIKDLVNEKRAAIYHVQRVDDGQTYEVVGRSIKSIEYYEDLLIAEAMKLVSPARKFDEALEYLKAVAARDPNWPGFLEARLRFHRAEAEQQAGRGMLGEAFLTLIEERRLFIELKGKATQPLDDERWEGRFNSLINRWVDQLYRVENRYDDARRAISRAEIAYPECQAAAEWRRRYGERTNQLVAQANQQKQAGDLKSAFESLAEAMEVDPQAPNVKSAVEALYTDYPVLRVAVGRLPMYESGPAEWSPADVRAADLIHIPIMWMESAQDGGVYASHLIDQPERPNEFVNQRAILTLKEGEFKWPGDNKPVTVIDIERLLASYCQPGPLYHPAFEPLMEAFTPLLPNRLQIDFFRPQFQPAIWLQGPFFRMSPDPSVPQSVARFMPALSGLGPYRLDQSRRGGAVAYTHNPVYLHKGKPIIKQVVERRYPTSAHRLRALKNGDVHMIDYVPPRHHAHVKNMAGTKLLRMARPRVHVLQFN